jgi:hypothetical protein
MSTVLTSSPVRQQAKRPGSDSHPSPGAINPETRRHDLNRFPSGSFSGYFSSSGFLGNSLAGPGPPSLSRYVPAWPHLPFRDAASARDTSGVSEISHSAQTTLVSPGQATECQSQRAERAGGGSLITQPRHRSAARPRWTRSTGSPGGSESAPPAHERAARSSVEAISPFPLAVLLRIIMNRTASLVNTSGDSAY